MLRSLVWKIVELKNMLKKSDWGGGGGFTKSKKFIVQNSIGIMDITDFCVL